MTIQQLSCLILISFLLLKPTHWTTITFPTLSYSHSIFLFIFQPHKSKLPLQPLSNRVTAWQWRRNLREWLYILVKSHMDHDTGYNHGHRARAWCQVKRLLAQRQLEATGLCSGLLFIITSGQKDGRVLLSQNFPLELFFTWNISPAWTLQVHRSAHRGFHAIGLVRLV